LMECRWVHSCQAAGSCAVGMHRAKQAFAVVLASHLLQPEKP